MDRTKLFKDIFGLMVLERERKGQTEGNMNFALPAKRTTQAYKILRSITAMKKFLLSRRRDYVRGALSTESRSIAAELERWRTDQLVEQFARDILRAIDALSRQTVDNRKSLQVREHRENVRALLRHYLSSTCEVYAEMKAVYVKRVCDRHKWGSLGSCRKLGPGRPRFLPASLVKGLRQLQVFSSAASKIVSVANWLQSTGDAGSESETASLDLDVTYEERAQFEEESKVLLDRFNSTRAVVHDIESQVIDIACLQRALTSQILQQDDDVAKVAAATLSATANVTAAARVLQENTVDRTTFGYYAASTIFLLSLLLLLLHWLTP
ncbi:syntaxin-18-like [Haemaphysalis longicornis]